MIQASGWSVTAVGDCVFRTMGNHGDMCRQKAVIKQEHEGSLNWVEYLCDEHMGSFRWIDEGIVMQWRANPPWTYKRTTKVPYKPRKKVTNA